MLKLEEVQEYELKFFKNPQNSEEASLLASNTRIVFLDDEKFGKGIYLVIMPEMNTSLNTAIENYVEYYKEVGFSLVPVIENKVFKFHKLLLSYVDRLADNYYDTLDDEDDDIFSENVYISYFDGEQTKGVCLSIDEAVTDEEYAVITGLLDHFETEHNLEVDSSISDYVISISIKGAL